MNYLAGTHRIGLSGWSHSDLGRLRHVEKHLPFRGIYHFLLYNISEYIFDYSKWHLHEVEIHPVIIH